MTTSEASLSSACLQPVFNTLSPFFFLCADAIPFGNAVFGQGSGPILFENVSCSGSELSLSDCPSSQTSTCVHDEDAGVSCSRNGKLSVVIIMSPVA